MTARLIHCVALPLQAGERVPPHQHPFHECLLLEGLGLQTRLDDGATHHVDERRCCCYPAGMQHSERVLSAGTCIVVAMAGLPDDLPVFIADPDRRLSILARWLLESRHETEDSRAGSEQLWASAFERELRRLARRSADGPFDDLRRWMRAHRHQALRVAELAGRCAMSPAHFSRCYRRAVGRPPMQDLATMRAELAVDLLHSTDWPVRRIAERCGCCDDRHLAKLLRRHLGCNASSLRRELADRSDSNRVDPTSKAW